MLSDGVSCSDVDEEVMGIFDLNDIDSALLSYCPWYNTLLRVSAKVFGVYVDKCNVWEGCLTSEWEDDVWELPSGSCTWSLVERARFVCVADVGVSVV